MNIPLENYLKARHRPNAMPLMYQNWKDLLFLHWKFDAAEIQRTLPTDLFVDTFRGDAYLSIIPFFMRNVSIFKLPSFPGLTNFVEINVRTYVYDKNGLPGVWFYTLDLNSLLASRFAWKAYALPYFFSKLRGTKNKDKISIHGERIDKPKVPLHFVYQPSSTELHIAEPNTLEFFLVERYFLFSFASNQLYNAQVHHQPYSLKDATVYEWTSDLLDSFNFLKRDPDYVHFSPGVNVDIFRLKKVIYKS